ncbi:hypothetical protein NIES4073_38190 [Kalymmatonema gypsitolerans NIES-4073]|nr:hypothetical protein NIES4073_38190 [Scytonema sp. NIES-4073]
MIGGFRHSLYKLYLFWMWVCQHAQVRIQVSMSLYASRLPLGKHRRLFLEVAVIRFLLSRIIMFILNLPQAIAIWAVAKPIALTLNKIFTLGLQSKRRYLPYSWNGTSVANICIRQPGIKLVRLVQLASQRLQLTQQVQQVWIYAFETRL